MIQYLRIPRNKFWGWVFTSLALGLVLGAGVAYAVTRASSAKQIDDLKKQAESRTAQAASTTASLQSRLDSADASLTALSQQYTQLQQQEAATKAAAKNKSSSTTKTVTLEVTSRTVSPSTVTSGDPITLTAKVQGHPSSVSMRVTSSALGVSLTYSLRKVSTSGSIERWRRVVDAPKKRGTYRYYAIARVGDKTATMPGASISTFKVE